MGRAYAICVLVHLNAVCLSLMTLFPVSILLACLFSTDLPLDIEALHYVVSSNHPPFLINSSTCRWYRFTQSFTSSGTALNGLIDTAFATDLRQRCPTTVYALLLIGVLPSSIHHLLSLLLPFLLLKRYFCCCCWGRHLRSVTSHWFGFSSACPHLLYTDNVYGLNIPYSTFQTYWHPLVSCSG